MSSKFDTLTRENIDEYVVSTFGHPSPRDAAVKLIEFNGQKAIFKDLRPATRFSKFLFGRHALKNEYKTYQYLEGVPGIPRPYKLIDDEGFLIEYINCPRTVRKNLELHPDTFDNCAKIISGIHEKGVLHLDLRNRKNFLLGKDGSVHIIDFASALHVPDWLPLRKKIVRWLSVFDKSGILKMKRKLTPEKLTAEEQKWLKRYDLIRAIIFPPGIVLRWIIASRRNEARTEKRLTKEKARAQNTAEKAE